MHLTGGGSGRIVATKLCFWHECKETLLYDHDFLKKFIILKAQLDEIGNFTCCELKMN